MTRIDTGSSTAIDLIVDGKGEDIEDKGIELPKDTTILIEAKIPATGWKNHSSSASLKAAIVGQESAPGSLVFYVKDALAEGGKAEVDLVTAPCTWNATAGTKQFYVRSLEAVKFKLIFTATNESNEEKSDSATAWFDGCGCNTCVPGTAEGNTDGSLNFKIGMGQDSFGHSAGQLSIHADEYSTSIGSVTSLQTPSYRTFAITKTTGDDWEAVGTWGKVVAADGTANDDTYQIEFYSDTAGTDLYKKYIVDAATTNIVKITEMGKQSGSSTLEDKASWTYTWDSGENKWTLVVQDPSSTTLRQESRKKSVAGDVTTETVEIKDASNNVIEKYVEQYKEYAWGRELIQRDRWTGGSTDPKLTSKWSYGTNTESDSYGRLVSYQDEHTGYWETYSYDETDSGDQKREKVTVKQLGVNEFDDQTGAANNVAEIYRRYEVDADSDSQTDDDAVDYYITKSKNAQKHVRFTIWWTAYNSETGLASYDERWDVECADPTPLTDSGNSTVEELIQDIRTGTYTNVRITKTWTIKAGEANEFKTACIERWDGTTVKYDYQGITQGIDKQVVSSGFGSAGNVYYGTRTTTDRNLQGTVTKAETKQIVGGLYIGLIRSREAVNASDIDEFGRVKKYTYLDGTTTQTAYNDCCGSRIETDQYGIQTKTETDALGRTFNRIEAYDTSVATMISYRTDYDAAGRVVRTWIDTGITSSQYTTSDALQSTSVYDAAGRLTEQGDGAGNKVFYTYRKVCADSGANFGVTYVAGTHDTFYNETRVYPHKRADGPIQVTWTDGQGRTVRSFTVSTTSTDWAGSAPTGSETFNTEHSRTVYIHDWAGRTTETHSYYNLSGLTVADEEPESTPENYYYTSTYDYDTLGRQWKSTDTIGDITITKFDDAGRTESVWRGTDATGGTSDDPNGTGGNNNMIKVSETWYDTDFDRDSSDVDWRPYATRTASLKPLATLAGSSADYNTIDYETIYTANGSNALRSTLTKPATGLGPWSKQIFDLGGRLSESYTLDNGQSDHTTAANVLAKSTNDYDTAANGFRLIASKTHKIDPADGSDDGHLKTEYNYDDAGRQVRVKHPTGGYTKTEHDDEGRTLRTVFISSEGTTDSTENFTDDIVLTETVYTYDEAGNVVETVTYARTPDATATGLLSAAASSQYRPSYASTWFDTANRPTHSVYFGSVAPTGDFDDPTADGPPAPNGTHSDDLIVSKTSYDSAGRVESVTDNLGKVTRYEYDALGRQTKMIENYDDGTPDDDYPDVDRVTTFTYNAAGQVIEQTADMETDDQTTKYIYSAVLTDKGCPVKSNTYLRAIIFPDSDDVVSSEALASGTDTTFDRIEMDYLANGALDSRTDQRGTLIEHFYNDNGTRKAQRVTTLGGDTDDAVRAITYTYDDLLRPVLVTSHSSVQTGPTSTDVLNQIKYAYNGFGQLASEKQDHDSVVDATGGLATAEVVYTYDTTATSSVFTKGHRLKSVTYPNDRVVHVVYDGHDDIDDAIGRANALADDASGTVKIVEYEYLGDGTMVTKDLPVPDIKLSAWAATGSPPTEQPLDTSGGGRFDRFGRIIQQRWATYDGSGDHDTDLFDIRYTYDRASNKDSAARNVYIDAEDFDQDNLHRLSDRTRANEVPTTNLVAHWKFDNNGNDSSGNGNNATVNGSPTYDSTNQRLGTHALTLDGSDDYVDVSNARQTSDFTWSVWFKTSPDSDAQAVLAINTDGSGNVLLVMVGSTLDDSREGRISLHDSSAGNWQSETRPYVADGKWHHAAVAKDGTTVRLYVDGSKVDEYTTSMSLTSTDRWSIGQEWDGTTTKSDFLTGAVDDCRLYSAALSDIEIAALAREKDESWDLSPVGNWDAHTVDNDTETRTHNEANEIKTTSLQPTDPAYAYDMAGNLISDAQPSSTMSGPLSHWKLEDDATDANSTNNATAYGSPAYVNGYHNKAVQLDASDDYLDLDNAADDIATAGKFTLSFWAAVDSHDGTTDQQALLAVKTSGDGDRLLVQLDRTGETFYEQRLCIVSDSFSPIYQPPSDKVVGDGQWHHITVAYDDTAGVVRLYIDGELAHEAEVTLTFASSDLWTIGAARDSSTTVDFADGLIDDVRLFSRALSDQEVRDLARPPQRYAYDAWNRLVTIRHAYRTTSGGFEDGNLQVTYAYDGQGRRITRTIQRNDALDITSHFYHVGRSVIETHNGNDLLVSQQVWDNLAGHYIDSLVEIGHDINGSGQVDRRFYALTDTLYNVMAIVDTYGTVAERYEYTPYGKRTVIRSSEFIVSNADFDGDGDVDNSDLGVLSGNYGTGTGMTFADGDTDGDGDVDIEDLQTLSNAYTGSITWPDAQTPVTPADASLQLHTGVNLCDFGFQGKMHDTSVGIIKWGVRYWHPTMGRFITTDPHPSIYPDGPNRYAGYHIMHGGVDPSGLWKIDRSGGALASAVAEPGDTMKSLADKVGLERGKYRNWVTMTKVKLISKKSVTLSELGLTDEICAGETVEVPNVVFALWLGDKVDSITTDYREQVRELRAEGFMVEAVGGVGSKRSTVTSRVVTSRAFLADLTKSSSARELQGLLVEGHGNPWRFYNSDRTFRVSYAQVDRSIPNYKLATVILNVCNGGWKSTDAPVASPPRWYSVSDQIYYQMYGTRYRGSAGPTMLTVGGRDLVSGSGEYVFFGLPRGLNPLTENADVSHLFPHNKQGTK